jgi:hypothetical protein
MKALPNSREAVQEEPPYLIFSQTVAQEAPPPRIPRAVQEAPPKEKLVG